MVFNNFLKFKPNLDAHVRLLHSKMHPRLLQLNPPPLPHLTTPPPDPSPAEFLNLCIFKVLVTLLSTVILLQLSTKGVREILSLITVIAVEGQLNYYLKI